MKFHIVKRLTPIFLFILPFTLFSSSAFAQSEESAISQTLTNYIQGTSYSRPQQIEKTFYQDAHLLLQKKNTPVWRVPVQEYISWFKKSQSDKFNGRIGEILNIDVAGELATAKVEIIVPKKSLRYVDLFLLKKFGDAWKIISKTAASQPTEKHGDRILFIVSNAHFHGSLDKPAGASFSEIIYAYHTFKEAGYTVDFVSPEGGAIPLAYINTSDSLHKQYLYDTDFMYSLRNTKTPQEITPGNYKAVQYIGGSSAMYGVADNEAIQKLAMEIYEKQQGIISAVCHGTAGIVHLKTRDGKYLVSGKRISGYPEDYENMNAPYFKQFPFMIKATIENRDGIFKFGPANQPHIEVDGRVITGQNYLSSVLVAEKIIEQLRNNKEQ